MEEGKYFCADAPETITEYAKEFQEYIIDPLVEEGYTRMEAMTIHLAYQLRHLRYDVQELGTSEKENWE